MSIQVGLPGSITTGDMARPNGFQSPVLAGRVADNVTSGPGPLYKASGFMCVQSTASIVNQILSTADAVIGNRASFVYVPVTTGSLVGAAAPAYTGVGTPIVWNDALKSLNIWSSGSSSWLVLITSSGGSAGFSSSG